MDGAPVLKVNRTPVVYALRRIVHLLVTRLIDTLYAIRYEWRKARNLPVPHHARISVPDVVQDRAEAMGITAEDEASIVLYRDSDGRFFTQEMMQKGKYIPRAGNRVTEACEIGDQAAEELLSKIEAMSLETDLTENDRILMGVLRKKLDTRWLGGAGEDR